MYELDVSLLESGQGEAKLLREAKLPSTTAGLEYHTACLVNPCSDAPSGGILFSGGRINGFITGRAFFMELDTLQVNSVQVQYAAMHKT